MKINNIKSNQLQVIDRMPLKNIESLNPTLHGEGHNDTPPLSSCALGIAFWGTPIGWQFLFTLTFDSSFYFGAKIDVQKVL